MTQPAHIDADFVDTSPAPLAVVRDKPPVAPQLFDALRPAERIALMTEMADAIVDVIEKRKWYTVIDGHKHIRIEGWTFIGGLGGASAEVTHVDPIDGGFKAHAVVVRTDSGIKIGGADQVCMRSEKGRASKPDNQIIGMACTRACSRALAQVFRHVVELAGYKTTPAEEMTPGTYQNDPAPPRNEQPHEPTFSQTDLVRLGERKGYPGKSFGTWLVENVASDLRTREHKVLRPDEIAVARDLLDAMPDVEEPEPPQPQRTPRAPSESQKKMLFALHSQRGDNDGDRHLIYKRLCGKTSFKDLTADDVARVIDYIDPQKAR